MVCAEGPPNANGVGPGVVCRNPGVGGGLGGVAAGGAGASRGTGAVGVVMHAVGTMGSVDANGQGPGVFGGAPEVVEEEGASGEVASRNAFAASNRGAGVVETGAEGTWGVPVVDARGPATVGRVMEVEEWRGRDDVAPLLGSAALTGVDGGVDRGAFDVLGSLVSDPSGPRCVGRMWVRRSMNGGVGDVASRASATGAASVLGASSGTPRVP
jgi:hypothetical protein